ncbi:hypothetical protein [Chromobacterium aquaticum]|uniref:DUF4240 domain-containing protein n=1 Tax=Chromobacterium aquaticum TaxID=467180 RepID=A0ABV8ZRY7_9NEIS|nr:hypothetical protein [Chromobacterium aquaticum]MCD5362663.1 hypothetical protein [Chromobacterium aquaticum]
MSEALVFYAEIPLSNQGFNKWLARPMAIDGQAGCSVLDALADYLAQCCDPVAGNALLCRYQRADKTLQFAACLRDGSSRQSRDDASFLKRLWQELVSCRGKAGKPGAVADAIVDWSEAGPGDAGDPAWFREWLQAMPLLGAPDSQGRWLDREILRALAAIDAVANASPEHPARIGCLYTDGVQVYADVAGKTIMVDDAEAAGGQRMEFSPALSYVLEGAQPRSMRALSDSYYTDGNILWHCNIFAGNAPQALAYCEGQAPRLYKFVDSSVDALIVLGDMAWSAAMDDSKPPHERYYVKSVAIDGQSFARVAGGNDFQDRFRRYRFDERRGLLPLNPLEA